jgi:Zn-dependent protease with chaperone function
MGPRSRVGWIAFVSCLALAAPHAQAAKVVKAQGYLEYRKTDALIVDGQRVLTTSKTQFRGGGKAKNIATIPIGYEVTAEGTRQADGSIAATKLTTQPNGMAMFEGTVLQATTEAEDGYVKAGKIADQGQDGKEHVLGTLKTSGPEVDRCRKIVDRLLPSYVDPTKVRIYVVDNKEWNAMAMANFSIYVFSGLMADMDDDELALVLGHELTHATHEHSRKQAKQSIYTGVGAQAVAFGASKVTSGVAKDAAQAGVALGATTFGNVYSREYEDQADRVGLRYAYEAGYDYKKAPKLWKRFAEKYGDQSSVENFFFGNHSLSSKRAAALEQEIKHNYNDPKKDPPTKTAVASK